MTNRYLEILELTPGATKEEIKKAYRRLSKKYHPDLGKETSSREKFIELTEAYDFLLEAGPTPHNEEVAYDYDPFVSEYDQWRVEARARAKKKAEEKATFQLFLIRSILKRFDYVAWLAVIFNFVLFLDYYLPRGAHPQEIVAVERVYENLLTQTNRGSRVSYRYEEIYFVDFKMRFDKGEISSRIKYEKALVLATPILKQPITALLTANGEERAHHRVFSVYRVFGFLIPGIVILFFVYRLNRNPNYKLSFAIVMGFGFLFQLFVFFVS